MADEKAAIDLVESLLVELEHLQNIIDLLAQGFIYERKDQETSSMQVLSNHIKSIRKEYDERLTKLL